MMVCLLKFSHYIENSNNLIPKNVKYFDTSGVYIDILAVPRVRHLARWELAPTRRPLLPTCFRPIAVVAVHIRQIISQKLQKQETKGLC